MKGLEKFLRKKPSEVPVSESAKANAILDRPLDAEAEPKRDSAQRILHVTPEDIPERELSEKVRRVLGDPVDAPAGGSAGDKEPDFIEQATPTGSRLVPVEQVEAHMPPEGAVVAKAEADKPIPKKMEAVELRMAGLKREVRLAEDSYLKEYKAFLLEKQRDRKAVEGARLLELKKSFDESRIKYGKALEEYAQNRYFERVPDRRMLGRKVRNVDDVMERYNSLWRHREVVKTHAERKLKVEEAALDEKGQASYLAALSWVARKNTEAEAKWGKPAVRAAKVLAAALLGSGVGALGGAAAVTALGYGAWRGARAFLSMTVGTSAALGAAELVDDEVQDRSVKKERGVRRQGSGQDLTAESLAELDAAQGRLTKKMGERASGRRKMLMSLFVGFGFGATTSALLTDLPSVQAAAEAPPKDGNIWDQTRAEMRETLHRTVHQIEGARMAVDAMDDAPQASAPAASAGSRG